MLNFIQRINLSFKENQLVFNLDTTAAGHQRAWWIQMAFFTVAEPDSILGHTNTCITVCCPASLSLNLCAAFPKSAMAQIMLCLPV